MATMTRKSFLRAVMGMTAASAGAACQRSPAQGESQTASAPLARQVPVASPATAAPSTTDKAVARVVSDIASSYAIGALYIGDRLGLFKVMAAAGPMTVEQLAAKTKFDTHYVAEWLRVVTTSGYVEYRPSTRTFELPAAYQPVIVDEDSPAFMAGLYEGVVPDIAMIPRVMDGFRTGKGIPYGDYPAETFESIERGTRPDYLHLMVQEWLPAVPGIVDRLRQGGTAADLGSGAGLASIAIAKAFPACRAVGFEPYQPSVKRAMANAKAGGLSQRVTFRVFDGVHVPAGPYDLITINYSLHHAGKPVDLLRSARAALAPAGAMLVAEYRKSDRFEEDVATDRRLMYGIGLLECMPTALAEGGPGYGTGIPEVELRRLGGEAGFRECTRILADDPLRLLVVLRG